VSKDPRRKGRPKRPTPTTFEDRIRWVAEFLAAYALHDKKGDPKKFVLSQLKAALEAPADRQFVRVMEFQGELQEMVITDGIFRMIFNHDGFNRTDMQAQELLYRMAEDHLDKVLRDPDALVGKITRQIRKD